MAEIKLRIEHLVLKASLRLWSDFVPLKPIAERLGLQSNLIHVKGEKKSQKEPLNKSVASRHYSIVYQDGLHSNSDLLYWYETCVSLIEDNEWFRDLLLKNDIEALVWIAVFGPSCTADPILPKTQIEAMNKRHVKIMIENYTRLINGNPSKQWL